MTGQVRSMYCKHADTCFVEMSLMYAADDTYKCERIDVLHIDFVDPTMTKT